MTSLPVHVRTTRPRTQTIEHCDDRAGRGAGPHDACRAVAGPWIAETGVPVLVRATSPRPVLLVHGLGGRKSGWYALTRALKAEGVTVRSMSYSSFGTSVEQVAEELESEVASLRSETGADKVHLVGHSLGGVVIAQALADGRLRGQVDTVVTIAAPFGGSPWANLLPLGAIMRALRQGSPLLRRLALAPAPEGVQWLAFTATLDMIVPGRRAVPPQAEAETVSVDHVGHIGLLFDRQVVRRIVFALC
jgi:triacylglycerol lipase